MNKKEITEITGPILNREQVMKRLRISATTLWIWQLRGEFPKPLKLKNRLYWKKEDITEWLKGKTKTYRSK